MIEHTPGLRCPECWHSEMELQWVCETCGYFVDLSNDSLIAAAPALLEACKIAYALIGNSEISEKLGAAIAKAEGKEE